MLTLADFAVESDLSVCAAAPPLLPWPGSCTCRVLAVWCFLVGDDGAVFGTCHFCAPRIALFLALQRRMEQLLQTIRATEGGRPASGECCSA